MDRRSHADNSAEAHLRAIWLRVPDDCEWVFPGDAEGKPLQDIKRFWDDVRAKAYDDRQSPLAASTARSITFNPDGAAPRLLSRSDWPIRPDDEQRRIAAGNDMRRAIVVGGSLGGLFAACMLLRSGWDVVVIERAKVKLAGRGAGLGVHPPMLEGLVHAGAHVDANLGVAIGGRAVLARDGSIAAEIAMPQFCTSWARLYTMLSNVFPDERVRRGVALAGFDQDADGVTARLSDGASLRGDVLI
eukprot:gene58082-77503_t